VVVTGPSDDPVLRRRAQIARLADLGQKVGYGLFGVAVVAFVVAAVVGFSPAWVTVIVVAMLVGSVVLAPAIVLGFAAKAADREDREVGR
jgi:predicted membrane protein